MTKKSSDNHAFSASHQQPCLLCGKEDWCYLVHNQQGEIEKIICNRTSPGSEPSDWEHSGTARDGRPVFIKKGVRRAKKRRNRSFPELIQLQPSPKSNIPQWQNVVIPLDQLSQGHTVRLKPGNPGDSVLYLVKKVYLGKRQGKNCLLANLVIKGGNGGCLEIEVSEIQKIVTSDPQTGAKEQFIEYYYSDTLKVVRTQWSDRRSCYPGKQNKKVRPWYKVGEHWVEGKGGREFPLYQFNDVACAIRRGEIVFGVGGEQAVDTLATLGLAATTNQGGEASGATIAEDLAPIFQEVALCVVNAETPAEPPDDVEHQSQADLDNNAPQLKPLLVIWGDNDPKGAEFTEELHKLCFKYRIAHVILDPLLVWSGMPSKGDVKDWVNWCREQGMNDEEILLRLEMAIEAAIDFTETDANYRWQRSNWNAPISWKGEIGKWIQSKDKENPYWQPCCNFDFQVERELEDVDGGGLVLQVKRSFETRQYRCILNSCDYTNTDKFVDALKAALGTGIVCNLSKHELGALIHTRLHEYRTNRSGKVYKRIDRYGQQEDGTWVFRERQYTQFGLPTSESETGWVFNPSLGKDDHIPCPELAPEDPKALERLLNAARRFYGAEIFYQVLLTIGWVVAGLHFQTIFKQENCFTLYNAHGAPGSCKTLAAETAASLVGTNWAEMGMLARVSPSALYEHGSRTGSLPFFWDDPERKPENEELAKSWYNAKPRKVRGNEQTPHSPMGITSNHVFGGDQPATLTRFIRNPFKRFSGGSKDAFQELKQAQRLASGAFPMLLQIGYPRDAIAEIERQLLTHLPFAHARVAQSLAIVTYYAQAVVNLTGGSENVLQWVITNICHTENDAENVGDSLPDFVAKIQSLEGQNLVGDWNKQIVSTSDGRSWVAIHAEDVWGLVDRHFKPATYNKKSLKSLVNAAGGKVDSVQRFAISRDEVLTYYAAEVSPRLDRDGNEIPPNPPRAATRKAWLLPIELFGGGDTSPGSGGDGGSDSPPSSPSPVLPSFSGRDLENNNPVTAVTEMLPKTVTSQNPDDCLDSDDYSDPVTTVTKKINQKEIEQNLATIETASISRCCPVINSSNSGNTVIAEAKTQIPSQLQPVTDSVTAPGGNSVTREDIALSPNIYTQQPQLAPTQAEAVKPDDAIAPQKASILATATEKSDEWLTLECLQDIALQLKACAENYNSKMLADLRQIFPSHALSAACKLLDAGTIAHIRKWVLSQNTLGAGGENYPETTCVNKSILPQNSPILGSLQPNATRGRVATAATDRYSDPVAAEVLVGSSVLALHPPTTVTSFKKEERIERDSFDGSDRTQHPNTPPISSANLVAALKLSPVSNTAATNESVAAKSPDNVQQLANQILLCTTWVEVAQKVDSNTKTLLAATRTMTKGQRRSLTNLLVTHLCDNPTEMSQLVWIPEKLRQRALERLTFTIRRIGGNNIEDAKLEYLSGCKFVSVTSLGDRRREQWVFRSPEGKNLPVFGIDAIEAIALSNEN